MNRSDSAVLQETQNTFALISLDNRIRRECTLKCKALCLDTELPFRHREGSVLLQHDRWFILRYNLRPSLDLSSS
jgi:hypothetical protein